MWDVLAFGAVAVDDICYVDRFPDKNVKLEVRAVDREAGGLAGNVVVTAARMGRSAAYCGVLGSDELSRFTRGELEREGVDCSPTAARDGAMPFHSFVIVDETDGSRTILYSGEGVIEPETSTITSDLIRRCGVLFVDHTAPTAGLAAARLARELQIPVVADIERVNTAAGRELLGEVDHLIIGIEFARELTGRTDPEVMVRQLMQQRRGVVAVTDGENGCWWTDSGELVNFQPAFQVEAVDTLGCGDVFHGAYAASLAAGSPAGDAFRFAAAAGAIKATRRGVRAGIPGRDEVLAFLKQQANC